MVGGNPSRLGGCEEEAKDWMWWTKAWRVRRARCR